MNRDLNLAVIELTPKKKSSKWGGEKGSQFFIVVVMKAADSLQELAHQTWQYLGYQ